MRVRFLRMAQSQEAKKARRYGESLFGSIFVTVEIFFIQFVGQLVPFNSMPPYLGSDFSGPSTQPPSIWGTVCQWVPKSSPMCSLLPNTQFLPSFRETDCLLTRGTSFRVQHKVLFVEGVLAWQPAAILLAQSRILILAWSQQVSSLG